MLFPVLQRSMDTATIENIVREYKEEGIILTIEDGHVIFWGWEND